MPTKNGGASRGTDQTALVPMQQPVSVDEHTRSSFLPLAAGDQASAVVLNLRTNKSGLDILQGTGGDHCTNRRGILWQSEPSSADASSRPSTPPMANRSCRQGLVASLRAGPGLFHTMLLPAGRRMSHDDVHASEPMRYCMGHVRHCKTLGRGCAPMVRRWLACPAFPALSMAWTAFSVAHNGGILAMDWGDVGVRASQSNTPSSLPAMMVESRDGVMA